jgi:hypothetical protein
MANVFAKVLGYRGAEELHQRSFTDKERIKVERTLKQLKFHVIHRGDNFRRRYKIKKISEHSARETHFSKGMLLKRFRLFLIPMKIWIYLIYGFFLDIKERMKDQLMLQHTFNSSTIVN